MTGYYLSIGYMSGYSGFRGSAWGKLVEIVEALRMQPERIVREVLRVEPDADLGCDCCTLHELAACYAAGDRQVSGREALAKADGTLVIDYEGEVIIQYASGDRAKKEAVRRAFCRLVIEDGHRAGLEIELQVT